MGLLDRLFGGTEKPQATPVPQPAAGPPQSADERALAQYRYMLQTAPPQTIEQAHTEAFAKLSPQQRSLLLTQLAADCRKLNALHRELRHRTIPNPWRGLRHALKFASQAPWSVPSRAWVGVAWEWAA